jgi:hypothetical protein
MPTLYPGAIDNFGTVPESQAAATVHRERHENVEDAVEALEAFIGTAGGVTPGTVVGDLANAVTKTGAQTITGDKLFSTPTTYTEFRRDTAPLNYVGTRASVVVQHRDAAAGVVNAQIPGVVFQFTSSGNGVVNAGTELSQSIWLGLQLSQTKTGDGSGHCATAIGELGSYGPGLYNELGMFQGTATNVGSQLGTMSGAEMLLRDSPDAGTTTYSTRMDPFVARIGKYNATTRRSHGLLASSEGTLPPDTIVGATTGGAGWKRAMDLSGVNITTGQVILSPNNTFLAWLMAGTGTAVPIFGVSAANNGFAAMPTNTTSFIISTTSFATRLEVDNNATNAVLIWVNGALKRVEVGAPDSDGVGFRSLRVAN